MCFSPAASFVTAGLTGAIGVLCLAKASQARELPLAAIPLIFALQQTIEGALWLVLPAAPHGAAASALTLMFLLSAKVFWPVYAPMAARAMESDPLRRRLMLVCLCAGVAIGGYFFWRILAGPRDAAIVNSCIVYRAGGGHPVLSGLAYLAATSLPLVLSSRWTLVTLGAVMLVGCVVAYAFYWEAFISVWCFFAAAASVVILGHFETVRHGVSSKAGA